MKKNKLIQLRKQKGYTQEYMASSLFMDVSSYNRREKGLINISEKEWDKIAIILDVSKEEIYENGIHDEKIIDEKSDYEFLNFLKSAWETQKKYIHKLEEEIKLLKSKKD